MFLKVKRNYAYPASISLDSQRIRDDADVAPLYVVIVATKRVVGLEWGLEAELITLELGLRLGL